MTDFPYYNYNDDDFILETGVWKNCLLFVIFSFFVCVFISLYWILF